MREVEMLMRRVRQGLSCTCLPGTPSVTSDGCCLRCLCCSWGVHQLLALPLWRCRSGAADGPPCCTSRHPPLLLPPQDQGQGKIAFVDVAASDYDPAQNGGISFEKAMEAS